MLFAHKATFSECWSVLGQWCTSRCVSWWLHTRHSRHKGHVASSTALSVCTTGRTQEKRPCGAKMDELEKRGRPNGKRNAALSRAGFDLKGDDCLWHLIFSSSSFFFLPPFFLPNNTHPRHQHKRQQHYHRLYTYQHSYHHELAQDKDGFPRMGH